MNFPAALNAVAAGLNFVLFAATGNPISLGFAVFSTILAIAFLDKD